MKSALLIVIYLCFWMFSNILYAQPNYYLIYDKDLSQTVGAENLITIHKAFYTFQDKYLPPTIIEEPKGWNRKQLFKDNWLVFTTNFLYRTSKTMLIDLPISSFLSTTQHEVFGHGARFREFGANNNGYQINFPLPYGKGGGWAYAYGGGPPTSIDENMAVFFSGSESNSVMADIMRSKWVIGDSIHYRESMLYNESLHNLTMYIFGVRWNWIDITPGNDIKNYVDSINHKYSNISGKKYSINDLAWHTAVNFLDPFQFFAIFSYSNYISFGYKKIELPMISFWGIKYLPSFNLALTPFGTEFYFNNFIKHNEQTYKIYCRYGDPKFETFWGAGATVHNIIVVDYLTVNASMDFWKQPSLELQDGNDTFRRSTSGMGYRLQTEIELSIPKSNLGLVCHLGYKSDGYLLGENLSKSANFRLGLFLK